MSGGSVLRERAIGALLAAEVISRFGSQMTFLALPWFVRETTGSNTRMGIVLAAELLPIALLGIPSGTVIARIGGRRTMLVADLARTPLVAAIPVLHATGILSFPLLLALVALVGCFHAPYFSSQRLVLPEIVGEDELRIAQANAFVEGANRVTALAGPTTAGVLIAFIGVTNVIYVDAATYLVSFLLVRALVPARPPIAETGESGGLLAGLRYLLRDRLLGPMILSVIVANFGGPALTVGLTALAYEDFERSSRVAGVLLGGMGAGSILGVVVALRLLPRVEPLRLAQVAFVLGTLPLWLLPFQVPVWALVLGLAAFGLANPVVNAPVLGVLTARTPEALRPKVMSAVITVATLASPLGAIAAGPLAQSLGPRAVLVLVAGTMTVSALAFGAVVAWRGGELAAAAAAETT